MTPATWLAPRHRPTPRWTIGLLLGALLFLPPAVSYLFNASSFAAGTIIAVVLAAVLLGIGMVSVSPGELQTGLAIGGLAAFVIVLHLLLAIAIGIDPSVSLLRALLSLLILVAVIVAAPIICDALMTGREDFTGVIRTMCFLFVGIAVLSILQIQPPTASLGEKPIFPFTEPSFFGFSLPAILIFTTIRSSPPVRAAWLIVFLGLGYTLGNFTIIAGCGLVALTVLPLAWIVTAVVVGTIAGQSLDLSYYTARLDFDWANSYNLSALVYVQGWQMLQEALGKSYGWGIGFQQLGFVYTNVPASMRITAILGQDANIQDGGFILSKLGSELGIFGLLLVLIYGYVAVTSFLTLRRAGPAGAGLSDGKLFARSCVIGYSMELLLRGNSYFTGTFVLLLAALLYLIKLRAARGADARGMS